MIYNQFHACNMFLLLTHLAIGAFLLEADSQKRGNREMKNGLQESAAGTRTFQNPKILAKTPIHLDVTPKAS